MYRKVCVTPAEMLTMREEGMSNHDIAKSLDVSYQTVVRYIGKQGKRIGGLAAFRDEPKKPETEVTEMATVMPKYNPKPIEEVFSIGRTYITLDNSNGMVRFQTDDGRMSIPYKCVSELVEFLAWAMRERMEAIPDEVRES